MAYTPNHFENVSISMKVFLDSMNNLPAVERRGIISLLKKKVCLTCGSERKGTGDHCSVCGEGLPT